jgi:hypothetical protein
MRRGVERLVVLPNEIIHQQMKSCVSYDLILFSFFFFFFTILTSYEDPGVFNMLKALAWV